MSGRRHVNVLARRAFGPTDVIVPVSGVTTVIVTVPAFTRWTFRSPKRNGSPKRLTMSIVKSTSGGPYGMPGYSPPRSSAVIAEMSKSSNISVRACLSRSTLCASGGTTRSRLRISSPPSSRAGRAPGAASVGGAGRSDQTRCRHAASVALPEHMTSRRRPSRRDTGRLQAYLPTSIVVGSHTSSALGRANRSETRTDPRS